MTIHPNFGDFASTHAAGLTQLVWTWVAGDLETPVSAFLKLAGDRENAFLLESVEGGATLGRYSSIGFDPDLVWRYERGSETAPLETLRRLVRESRIDHVAPGLPPMAASGLFGYLGYGMVGLIEQVPDTKPDPIGVPDSVMIRPTVMVIFDNVQSRICIATPVRDCTGDARAAYDSACQKIDALVARLDAPLPPPSRADRPAAETAAPDVRASISPGAFHDMVARAKDHIRAGNIFQVVLGQGFTLPFSLPPFSLYRSLRRTNPSPFLFYFNFGGFQLVGSSPEILVRVRDRRVTIRPIAGTRRRGATAAEDAALAQDLLADPKEHAEHLMLLDLGRNDVGRVAATGTVSVTEKFVIERYSHVMHIVSNVEGALRDDMDSLDALFAGFPAGTVSGAPKVRAMEIIDDLETTRRGYYGGCVGYLDGNGDLDTCIALRTALVKDGMIHVRASAGIVADSDPASEHNECAIKARAIVSAAEDALGRTR